MERTLIIRILQEISSDVDLEGEKYVGIRIVTKLINIMRKTIEEKRKRKAKRKYEKKEGNISVKRRKKKSLRGDQKERKRIRKEQLKGICSST